MYVPQNVGAGDCISEQYIGQLNDNIEWFRRCATTNQDQFVCRDINFKELVSFGVTAAELCFPVQILSTTTNPIVGNKIVRKLMIFSMTSKNVETTSANSVDNLEYQIIRDLVIKCNGEPVATLEGVSSTALVKVIPFSCQDNADIELCVSSRSVQTRGSTQIISVRVNSDIRVCGALICIKDVSLDKALPGFFSPPKVQTGCCYGRESIHLALQNLASLRLAFSEFGQAFDCSQMTFNDDDEHVLINTAPTETAYLLIGSLYICAQNRSTFIESEINATPSIVNGGVRQECLTETKIIPKSEATGYRSVECLRVPIVFCGVVQKGDDLITTLKSAIICDEKTSQIIERGIDNDILSIEQHFCLFTFAKQEYDFGNPLTRTLGKCIETTVTDSISDSMDLMDTICEAQQPIRVFNRRRWALEAPNGHCRNIDPGVALQPGQLPFDRKLFISGSVTACVPFSAVNPNVGNLERLQRVRATVTVTCGGVVIPEATRVVEWSYTYNGRAVRCKTIDDLFRCVECDSRESIEICFEGERLTGGFTVPPDEFSYDFQAFRF